MEKPKMVLIKYEDPTNTPGWVGIGDSPTLEDLQHMAVGFLIKEDEEIVSIAYSIGEDHTPSSNVLIPFTLPRRVIKEIIELTPKGDGEE